ncbi:MAG: hypothetical protein RIA08_03930 [Roseovarius sp.]|uniref:hypothetical protein n=1 Tax=Roseovarius sp. TaxID=1486281 RepID=UPI0032ED6411
MVQFSPVPAFLLAAVIALPIQPAMAETSVSIEVVREVETEEGERELQPVETAVPGEPLIYRIELENTDPVPATSIGLSLPLDESLAIDPETVSSETDIGVVFSADGGENFAEFSELSVEEGGTERQAQPTDLTHMRIEIEEIAAESTIAVEYDAVVR